MTDRVKRKKYSPKDTVLVCVLKSKRDRRLLLRERWYRIPVAFLPTRAFSYLAFYQPATFGRRGKRIEYFARVANRITAPRINLLPNEPGHPRADDDYVKFRVTRIRKLALPVRNIVPRRISFGFTDLKTLRAARDILELYGVPPTEQIIHRELKRLGVSAVPERTISRGGRRVRIDLAVPCRAGAVAIECDNERAHAGRTQRQKDKEKDAFLARLGFTMLRFREREIIEHLPQCISRIQKAVGTLGGCHS